MGHFQVSVAATDGWLTLCGELVSVIAGVRRARSLIDSRLILGPQGILKFNLVVSADG